MLIRVSLSAPIIVFLAVFVSLALFLDDECTGSDEVISVSQATCVSRTVTCPDTHQKLSNSFCKADDEVAVGEDCTVGDTCYSFGGELVVTTSFKWSLILKKYMFSINVEYLALAHIYKATKIKKKKTLLGQGI